MKLIFYKLYFLIGYDGGLDNKTKTNDLSKSSDYSTS